MIAEQGTGKEPVDIDIIASSLKKKLHGLGRELIFDNLDLTIPQNLSFYNNPDNPLEHQPSWHQWGIVTHVFMFEKFYRDEVPPMLDSWGVAQPAGEHFAEKVDGVSKGELLRVAILLHDIGKFTTRRFKRDGNGWNFVGHEAESGRIIREGSARKILEEHGLSDEQIEYVAMCADLHFELGIVRNKAKISKGGYSMEFANSESLARICNEIQSKYPDFKWEIGVLFLADSLAKTDETVAADSDQEILEQQDAVRQRLQKMGLRPELAGAVLQQPVNMKVAEIYLKTIVDTI